MCELHTQPLPCIKDRVFFSSILQMRKLQLTCSPEDDPDRSEVLVSRASSAELQLTSNEAPPPKAPNSINCVSAPAVFALIYLHNPTVPGLLDQTPEIVLTW